MLRTRLLLVDRRRARRPSAQRAALRASWTYICPAHPQCRCRPELQSVETCNFSVLFLIYPPTCPVLRVRTSVFVGTFSFGGADFVWERAIRTLRALPAPHDEAAPGGLCEISTLKPLPGNSNPTIAPPTLDPARIAGRWSARPWPDSQRPARSAGVEPLAGGRSARGDDGKTGGWRPARGRDHR